MACFDRDHISLQIGARVSPFGQPNASRCSQYCLLRCDSEHNAALKLLFCNLRLIGNQFGPQCNSVASQHVQKTSPSPLLLFVVHSQRLRMTNQYVFGLFCFINFLPGIECIMFIRNLPTPFASLLKVNALDPLLIFESLLVNMEIFGRLVDSKKHSGNFSKDSVKFPIFVVL